VILLPSTGTGGWEAAISNTLSPGDTVLAARFGMFSHRWIDMCQRHGLNVEVIEAPWGQGAPIAAIEAALRDDASHRIRAVLATHNETATGVRSDIAAVRGAMDAARHPALLFVDGVSSIGSMPFDMAGYRCGDCWQPEGFHAARRLGHSWRQPKGARGDGDRNLATYLL
jgi:alanine-glyoxylate transaminase / serine-glyoxylate transaminase / serine-pyruvate transaminase